MTPNQRLTPSVPAKPDETEPPPSTTFPAPPPSFPFPHLHRQPRSRPTPATHCPADHLPRPLLPPSLFHLVVPANRPYNRNPSPGSRLYREEHALHGDVGAPAEGGGDQGQLPSSSCGADAVGPHAPSFTDAEVPVACFSSLTIRDHAGEGRAGGAVASPKEWMGRRRRWRPRSTTIASATR